MGTAAQPVSQSYGVRRQCPRTHRTLTIEAQEVFDPHYVVEELKAAGFVFIRETLPFAFCGDQVKNADGSITYSQRIDLCH